MTLAGAGWHPQQQFSYGPEHQLRQATVQRSTNRQDPSAVVSQTTHYRYDALGRRVAKADAFGCTHFAYDGDLLSLEQRGARRAEYLYEDASFVPLARIESAAGEEDYALQYYHCDQIGAPQELSDEQGRIVWAANYKVWGEVQPVAALATGTDGGRYTERTVLRSVAARAGPRQEGSLGVVEQPLRFQGQYFDAETGLHYNRHRYYDPALGRFVSSDPIGLLGGTNLYAFGPNAAGYVDLLGLSARKLRINMGDDNRQLRAGQTPHHIVQENCNKNRHVQNSRVILDRNNIGIDDSANGAALWGSHPSQTTQLGHPGRAGASAAGTYHAGTHIHGPENDKLIYQILKGVEKRGGNVESTLRDIGQRMESGSWKATRLCCCP